MPPLAVLVACGDRRSARRVRALFTNQSTAARHYHVVAVPRDRQTAAAAWNAALDATRSPHVLFFSDRSTPAPLLVERCLEFASGAGDGGAWRVYATAAESARADLVRQWQLARTGEVGRFPARPGVYAWPAFELDGLCCPRALLRETRFDERYEAAEGLDAARRASRHAPVTVAFDRVPGAHALPLPIDALFRDEYLRAYFRHLSVLEDPFARIAADDDARHTDTSRFILAPAALTALWRRIQTLERARERDNEALFDACDRAVDHAVAAGWRDAERRAVGR